jgi:hypothetical protein
VPVNCVKEGGRCPPHTILIGSALSIRLSSAGRVSTTSKTFPWRSLIYCVVLNNCWPGWP